MVGSCCLTDDEQRDWSKKKHYNLRNDPIDYGWFKVRPLPAVFKMYAINDVEYLDRLANRLMKASEMTGQGLQLAFEWTRGGGRGDLGRTLQ